MFRTGRTNPPTGNKPPPKAGLGTRVLRAKTEALQAVMKVSFALGGLGMTGEYFEPTTRRVLTHLVVPSFAVGCAALTDGLKGNLRRAREEFRAPNAETAERVEGTLVPGGVGHPGSVPFS